MNNFVIPAPCHCHSRESGNPSHGVNSSGNPEYGSPTLSEKNVKFFPIRQRTDSSFWRKSAPRIGASVKTFGDDTWYQNAVSFLKQHNVPDPEISASSLLSYVLKQPRFSLELNPEVKLTQAEEEEFEALLKKRVARYPLQYLMKYLPFRNAVLEIGEGCLIPRPETELLAEAVLNKLPSSLLHILDIGTGSGNISISLAMERPSWNFTATDLSEDALQYAKLNSVSNQTERQINFVKADLFNKNDQKFDVIVSNPPYVKTEDLMNAQTELLFEPKMALDGGEDGLRFYRRIIEEARSMLKVGGFIFFEISYDQAKSVSELLMQHQFRQIEIIKDYLGLNRIISGRLVNHGSR